MPRNAPTSQLADYTIEALGTTVRVSVIAPDAELRAGRSLATIRRVHRTMSRFDATSELSQLNADPHETVATSWLLRRGVEAALWSARESGGLVDPTLLDAIRRVGYTRSLAGAPSATVTINDEAGASRAARPHPARRWASVSVDDRAGTVTRPVGLELDLGGSGKGLAADLAARCLEGADRWLIDCGGDLRVGGVEGWPVHVADPRGRTPIAHLRVRDGAAATSATHARAWCRADGRTAHHLLDPSTGEPAETGLVQVTALARTALAAETLAKTALLRGSVEGPAVVRDAGGVLVSTTGAVSFVGLLPFDPTPEPITRAMEVAA